MTVRAVVCGVGHYLPKRIVENNEFEATIDTTDEWIRSRSGIERRHFATENDTTSSMATEAARAALQDSGCEANDLDAIVLATLNRRFHFSLSSHHGSASIRYDTRLCF